MKKLLPLAAVCAAFLTLAGCGGHYVSPAEEQAVNRLKTITSDVQLCQALGAVSESANIPGGITHAPQAEFDVYYARNQYLKNKIGEKVKAGTFTLTPKQCDREKYKGAQMYQEEKQRRDPPPKSEWQRVLGE